MERVGQDQLLGLLARRGLVDDQAAAVVRERAGDDELSLLAEAGQVLPVCRAVLLDLGLILNVLDHGGELHGVLLLLPHAASQGFTYSRRMRWTRYGPERK